MDHSEKPTFVYAVEVTADTVEQADQVMVERIEHDEQYDDPETGDEFDYTIHWERPIPAITRCEQCGAGGPDGEPCPICGFPKE